jgi:hypothetical protein
VPSIKQIIDGKDTFAGRAFDFTVQVLIVVSLISFSIETLPGLSPQTDSVLHAIEIGTVAFFTIEYLLRVAAHTVRSLGNHRINRHSICRRSTRRKPLTLGFPRHHAM